ncbi:hypothetical protein [Silvibacterium dinghuense]|uniref:hypothetical protein n=1 Tax=Silvibacterium dinghuense TaxID=1560006 RepID=UPI0013E90878|nr:hypothetical protein [Silvibacterium dinghuense]GGH07078.1 hypothetical protein GCM10011586_24130 [Silvibacterium dinghuense]
MKPNQPFDKWAFANEYLQKHLPEIIVEAAKKNYSIDDDIRDLTDPKPKND